MHRRTGTPIAAVFSDHRSADDCLEELRRHDFHSPWSAVGKAAATADRTVAMPRATAASAPHGVAASSDGVAGAVGRFFSGHATLRQSLIDHGIGETTATEIDAALPFGGAVVVVWTEGRTDLAASILGRAGADVYGAAGRGDQHVKLEPADMASSGTGRGSSTGFLSDGAARYDAEIASAASRAEAKHTFYAKEPADASPSELTPSNDPKE